MLVADPAVRWLGLYLPAGVQIRVITVRSTPDNHFTSGPDCGVLGSAVGAFVGTRSMSSCSVLGSYFPPVFKDRSDVVTAAPDNHFTCRSTRRYENIEQQARCMVLVGCPTICRRIVSASSVQTACCPSYPPQTIISLPVHNCCVISSALGALVVLVGVQLSVLGLYLPPVFKYIEAPSYPPQTIISTAGPHGCVRACRPSGALVDACRLSNCR